MDLRPEYSRGLYAVNSRIIDTILMLVIYNFNYRQSKIFFSLQIEVISQEIV